MTTDKPSDTPLTDALRLDLDVHPVAEIAYEKMCTHAEDLERRVGVLTSELRNFVEARRFDKQYFEYGDTGFADWVQSRSRAALAEGEKK